MIANYDGEIERMYHAENFDNEIEEPCSKCGEVDCICQELEQVTKPVKEMEEHGKLRCN